MGCTSSAPNTISAYTNTADKSIQIEEDAKQQSSTEVGAADTEEENRTNENDTKVLPLCDKIQDTVQLVRNNKSTDSLAHVKDIPANGHVHESEEIIDIPNQTQHDMINVTKMELLMEKVFETNHHLNITEPIDEKDSPSEDKINEQIETTTKTDEGKVEIVIEDLENTGPQDNDDQTEMETENDIETLEVAESSPSASVSSRATRWEALADIAAELPPSLAVDPLTGQIYALSK